MLSDLDSEFILNPLIVYTDILMSDNTETELKINISSLSVSKKTKSWACTWGEGHPGNQAFYKGILR